MYSTRIAQLIVITILSTPMAGAAASPATEPVSGVWQRHDYRFAYQGVTSRYSCDGLEEKLALLLKAAGARPDIKVHGTCSSASGGPSLNSEAMLTFYTLAPTVAPGSVGAEPGLGAWQPVEFAAGRPSYVLGGDCELVEQFDRQLLPFFTIRNRSSHFNCEPHEFALGSIELRFETLAPLPKVPLARAAQ